MDTVKLRLTTPQLKKLQGGLSFQLSHPQLSGDSKGEHDIEVQLPSQHTKRLMKNISTGKGFRFPTSSSSKSGSGIQALGDKLKRDRLKAQHERMLKKAIKEEAPIEGGATYLQRLARRTRNTFKPVERAFKKEIIDSGVGKEIAKELIKVGTQYALPTATTALSMMAGDETGQTGRIIGNIAGKRLQGLADRSGYGAGVGGNMVRGAPRPLYTQRTTDRIMTHGLSSHKTGTRNGLVQGGSFLPLG